METPKSSPKISNINDFRLLGIFVLVNDSYQGKIEKIQSVYRGMKFRQKFYKHQSEMTNASNIKFI